MRQCMSNGLAVYFVIARSQSHPETPPLFSVCFLCTLKGVRFRCLLLTFMAAECSRTALASATRCWCNGKAAFCCVEQNADQDVAVHVCAQLALARMTLSLVWRSGGWHNATLWDSNLPNCRTCSLRRSVLRCMPWICRDQALISACNASLEVVPVGSKARIWSSI